VDKFDLLALFRLMFIQLFDIDKYELAVLALVELTVFQCVTGLRVCLYALFVCASCVCIYRRQYDLVVLERRLGDLFDLLLLINLAFGQFALGARVELIASHVVQHRIAAVLVHGRIEWLHEFHVFPLGKCLVVLAVWLEILLIGGGNV
jgi:hypothetical protein